jgi:hypothetical protein
MTPCLAMHFFWLKRFFYGGGMVGSVNENVEPAPSSPVEDTDSVPPCISTSLLLIANPMPKPP